MAANTIPFAAPAIAASSLITLKAILSERLESNSNEKVAIIDSPSQTLEDGAT